MKTLIYTVAYGEFPFVDMALNLKKTAFASGYTGEFRILREEHCFPGMPKAGLIRALSRAQIESYDKILYVDCDCVFLEDPAPLFGHTGVAAVFESAGISEYSALFLTAEERLKARAGVHSGALLLPGTQAYDFLEAWESIWLTSPRDAVRREDKYSWVPEGLMDQPALQAVLIRRNIPCARLRGMCFPLIAPEAKEGVLAHFCGDLEAGGHVANKVAVWNSIEERTARLMAARAKAAPK